MASYKLSGRCHSALPQTCVVHATAVSIAVVLNPVTSMALKISGVTRSIIPDRTARPPGSARGRLVGHAPRYFYQVSSLATKVSSADIYMMLSYKKNVREWRSSRAPRDEQSSAWSSTRREFACRIFGRRGRQSAVKTGVLHTGYPYSRAYLRRPPSPHKTRR